MMSSIQLALYDDHKIVQEGICSLLRDVDDIEIALKVNKPEQLQESLKFTLIHVLIINIHILNDQFINLIMQVNISHPKIKILILSVINDENSVLRTIKAGAKGFLAKDTDRNELIEAIYSLRNGFDYFSNSITHILLNRYIKKLKTTDEKADVNSLSSREIEIMKMWGNSNTNKEIAEKLFLSVRTVETHKNHIMQKLNLKTSVDMVKFAIRNNIIDL
jgi:two-component system response regulator NreC